MSATTITVFELSPAEKLQLVEDLWDDLAATPETVPIEDWQKEELARRKAKLRANPASALTWDEVKRRVRGPGPDLRPKARPADLHSEPC